MSNAIEGMRKNLYRRIIVRTIVFVVWIAGLAVALFIEGDTELLSTNTYIYMMVAIAAVGVLYTIRDVRRLRNEEYLKKAATRQTDERNVLITYKATRLAVVIALCCAPVAICVLAYLGMQVAINAIAACVFAFMAIYLVSWFALAKRN